MHMVCAGRGRDTGVDSDAIGADVAERVPTQVLQSFNSVDTAVDDHGGMLPAAAPAYA